MTRTTLSAIELLKFELCKLPFKIAKIKLGQKLNHFENKIVGAFINNKDGNEEELGQFADEVVIEEQAREIKNKVIETEIEGEV